MNSEQRVYDIEDVVRAGCVIEPLQCRHCQAAGYVVYHQAIADGYCELCGNWQLNRDGENR